MVLQTCALIKDRLTDVSSLVRAVALWSVKGLRSTAEFSSGQRRLRSDCRNAHSLVDNAFQHICSWRVWNNCWYRFWFWFVSMEVVYTLYELYNDWPCPRNKMRGGIVYTLGYITLPSRINDNFHAVLCSFKGKTCKYDYNSLEDLIKCPLISK